MKPPTLPPCIQPRNVSGACVECGKSMEPAHYQTAANRLTCGACCAIHGKPEPLADGPVLGLVGRQEGLF